MKTAILITAYKDFDLLLKLLSYYDGYFDCFVHVDKKIAIPQSFSDGVKSLKTVSVIQSRTINWGGYEHINAFLDLLKLAMEAGNEYFHLLPADAFPVKGKEYIKRFCTENKDKIFIESMDISEDQMALDRQRYYYFANRYDLKTDRGYSIQEKILSAQKKLGISRKIVFIQKGYLYCHFNRQFAEYIFDYIKNNPGYVLRLKSCFIPEEFFFQNIVADSPFKDGLQPRHLIYDDWQGATGGGPKVLTRAQLDEAVQSDCLFARKVNSLESGEYVLSKL